MRLKIALALGLGLLAAIPAFGAAAPPVNPKNIVVSTGIPGVVAAGAKWEPIWSDLNENSDGIVGTPDGGVAFAQAQAGQVRKVDPGGATRVLAREPNVGALAIDREGRIFAIMRDDNAGVAILYPERQVLMRSFEGARLTNISDIVVDRKGGLYITETGTQPTGRPIYLSPNGAMISLGFGVQVNGIQLSPDEKTLYVTNRNTIAAFDIQPDGSGANRRDFATLEGGVNGDGLAMDADGRLYVTTPIGVQVISPQGENLGTIPAPQANSLAFSGRDKKELFISAIGVFDEAGNSLDGIRPKTILKMPMLAQGVQGRAK